jgi:hypothetical protein
MTQEEQQPSDDPLRVFARVGPLLTERQLRSLIAVTTSVLVAELPAKFRPDALLVAEQLAFGVLKSPAITRLRSGLLKQKLLPTRVRRILTFICGGLNEDLVRAARMRLGELLSSPPVCEPNAIIAAMQCAIGNRSRSVTLDPEWLTSTVTQLARGIYDERDFDRLPILADALQDAGCDNADVLNHCRQPGPHARGCWVVDLVLGKH